MHYSNPEATTTQTNSKLFGFFLSRSKLFGVSLSVMANLSSYAVRMARLSARIFGDVVRPTDSRSMKVVQLFKEPPMAQKKEVYDWYPQHKIYYSLTQKLRYMGLFRDEHQDFKEEMRRLRKLRGKGKPKKGEGKRAMKKK
ncbi:hypothetical protein KOW79_016264 [Hemibagrus wyckioides]|uniref:Small ribosomal subunit protein mS33 n=2 Tax=Hemibagrus wyckioides TaxID=337641 RepID=A0A9D3NBN7_9TELE|nr:hypothetical protein KOW79_016264 [Hemibagrus wyckioides]